jgi:hypothetical protein
MLSESVRKFSRRLEKSLSASWGSNMFSWLYISLFAYALGPALWGQWGGSGFV